MYSPSDMLWEHPNDLINTDFHLLDSCGLFALLFLCTQLYDTRVSTCAVRNRPSVDPLLFRFLFAECVSYDTRFVV